MRSGPGSVWVRLLCLAGLLAPVTGCTNFFQCEGKASCPASTTTTTTTNTTDLAYVTYTDTAGASHLVGYDLAGGTLTPVANANLTLSFIPSALVVSPSNGYLYVATVPGATSPGIYGFAIGSTGALTALDSGAVLYSDTVGAMTISPDGDHLYTLNASGATMAQYTFTSTGALTSAGAVTVSLATTGCELSAATPVSQSCSVAVSPLNDYLIGSFGTAGDEVFPYSTSNGLTATGAYALAAGTSSGDFSVAMDGSDNAYVAQTAGLTVYQLGSTGVTNRGTVSYASGVVPRGVTLDPDYKFVFTANEGNGTISAFTTGTTTALTAVTGSPFTGPAHVAALGVDNTDSYVVAAGYDATAGIQLFALASTGVLSKVASTATSTATQYPVLVAMSH